MHLHPAPTHDRPHGTPVDPRGTLDVLSGFEARVSGRSATARVARRHLTDLGARVADDERDAPDGLAAQIVVCRRYSRDPACALVVSVSWDGAIGAGLVDEGTIQAGCGLMHVCGRRAGVARPVGVDYASIAAGVLAVQAVLAGLIACERGLPTNEVRTSVTDAALLAISQYLANATAPQDEPLQAPVQGEPPPFRSLEGVAFELEALDGVVWARFWAQLGVTGPVVGRAWRSFVFRYATADCALAEDLHVTTRSFPLDVIVAAADETGASVCVLRSHEQRMRQLGLDGGGRVDAVWKLTGLATVSGGLGAGDVRRDALPLSGLRVIEAGRRIQAPLAGHLLRLLGARVTRIEPPGGDPLRMMAPLAGDTSARFRALNDGKDVLEVNIKDARQRGELLDLATHADVFLHNWAPGKAALLGLDAEGFADRNPAIVYAYASAWDDALGDDAPLGTDFMVQAHAGLAETLTPVDEEPAATLMTLLDVMGGLVAVEGILAGLLRRQLTEQGQRVDTSLLSAATVLQADVLEAAASGLERGRVGGRPRWGTFDRPVPAADGLLWITVRDPEDLHRLACASLVDHEARDVDERILAHLRTRPVRELELALRAADVACAAVCEDLAQLAHDAPFLGALCFDGCAFVRAPWTWSR